MNIHNDYVAALFDYEQTPKAVYAAVAYSLVCLLHGEDLPDQMIEQAIRDEWQALHDAGIVPQKPRKVV